MGSNLKRSPILPMLTYRPATQADAPYLAGVYNQAVADGRITADTEPVSAQSRQDWLAARHARLERPCVIAQLDDGTPIGYATLADFYGRPAYSITAEIGIYLDAAYHGRGHGRQVLAHLLALAPGLGIENILAFIFSTNTASIRLFGEADFRLWGLYPDAARMPGGAYRTLEVWGLHVI